MRDHKNIRGKITEQEYDFINSKLDVINVVRRGVYEYLVLGKMYRQITCVDSGKLTPVLRQAYKIHINGDKISYLNRFLYTDEFNPSAR